MYPTCQVSLPHTSGRVVAGIGQPYTVEGDIGILKTCGLALWIVLHHLSPPPGRFPLSHRIGFFETPRKSPPLPEGQDPAFGWYYWCAHVPTCLLLSEVMFIHFWELLIRACAPPHQCRCTRPPLGNLTRGSDEYQLCNLLGTPCWVAPKPFSLPPRAASVFL